MFIFFFFQAEDGIRDKLVTGVQTCALPIFLDRVSTSGGMAVRSADSVQDAPDLPILAGRRAPQVEVTLSIKVPIVLDGSVRTFCQNHGRRQSLNTERDQVVLKKQERHEDGYQYFLALKNLSGNQCDGRQ